MNAGLAGFGLIIFGCITLALLSLRAPDRAELARWGGAHATPTAVPSATARVEAAGVR